MKFIVETLTTAGWENVWEAEDAGVRAPLTFDSLADAKLALEEHLTECNAAFERGDLATPPSPDDFRIVEGA